MYNGNPNITERGYMYGKWMSHENTWTISYNDGAVFSYLLIGEEKAMLIDTAYGEGNLRQYVEEITDKPVIVVNTHGHFDHTGGNPWWPEAYMSEVSTQDAKEAFGEEQQKAFNEKPYPDYKMNVVGDGYIFDLGGRRVEVIEIPCHHQGSIALLDLDYRLLFTGDEMEAGQTLLFYDIKNQLKQHAANMEKLIAREDEFDVIYPAHNGCPLIKKYLHDYLELNRQIQAGTQTVRPNTAGFHYPPETKGGFFGHLKIERAEYGGASICYKVEE